MWNPRLISCPLAALASQTALHFASVGHPLPASSHTVGASWCRTQASNCLSYKPFDCGSTEPRRHHHRFRGWPSLVRPSDGPAAAARTMAAVAGDGLMTGTESQNVLTRIWLPEANLCRYKFSLVEMSHELTNLRHHIVVLDRLK